MLESIEALSGQGAVYHGLHDAEILTNGRVCTFCRHALSYPAAASLCRYSCCTATVHAMNSGEPYFYQCWVGLLFVTIPIAPHNRCIGGISLGGFRTQDQRLDVQDAIAQSLGPGAASAIGALVRTVSSVQPIAPSALRGLGTLAMEATFSNGLNSSLFFRERNERYLQQRRIAEAFADIRSQDVSPPDLLRDTYELVSFLHRNDRPGAMEFVSRYLAKLLMASNWDLVKLKAHVRTLLAVITSHEILNGVPWAAATSRELRHMSRLEEASTTEESCYEVAEWIQNHFRRSEHGGSPDGRSLGDRLLAWLQSHYHESVTIAKTARAIGVSPSTLVHRLPRETGRTFKNLLLEIRISEGKKLLATTALQISAIAENCGFFDQSHFTRELKRSINLTPGQFRKLLRTHEEAMKGARQPTYDSRIAKSPKKHGMGFAPAGAHPTPRVNSQVLT